MSEWKDEYQDRNDRAWERVEVIVEAIVAETPKAWLIKYSGGIEDWFPKSVCGMEIVRKKKILRVPKWLMDKKEEEREGDEGAWWND